MLGEEQTEKIKKQLMAHIEKSFPEDKKDFAKNQVQTMDSEKLEAFLKQNNLIRGSGVGRGPVEGSEGCVFCSIVSGQISSYKLGENSTAMAALEINPVSKGHVIVIPKEHVAGKEKIPKSVFSLAESVSKLIKTKLKPKKIETSSSNLFGHEILNIVPVYDSESINSERNQANEEELLELQKTLLKKKSNAVSAKPKIKKSQGRKTLASKEDSLVILVKTKNPKNLFSKSKSK